MGKPENDVEQHLRERVEGAGGMCLKFTSSRNGVPDRVIVLNTHTVFVETKAPGEGLRKLQDVRVAKMRASGARVFTIASKQSADALVEDLMSFTLPRTVSDRTGVVRLLDQSQEPRTRKLHTLVIKGRLAAAS